MTWLLAFVTAACADDSIERARAVFEAYVHGYRSFDAKVVELYADAAIIQNTRRYPTGEVREIRVPAPKYKAVVAQLMPEMRSRGDRSQYLDPVFSQEGVAVRVRLTRFSELKQYASPMSLLIGADTSGTWRILEELSESRP